MQKLCVGAVICALMFGCLARPSVPDGLYAVAESGKLERDEFVPLVLESAPSEAKDANGRTLLSVSLAPGEARALEELSRAHLGGRVAIVVGGEVVSTHKLRSVIVGGKMQITTCGTDRCSMIRSRLLNR